MTHGAPIEGQGHDGGCVLSGSNGEQGGNEDDNEAQEPKGQRGSSDTSTAELWFLIESI